MKKIFIFLLSLIFSISAIGQIEKQRMLEEVEVTPPKFTGIEKVNYVPDSDDPMFIKTYLISNVQYPDNAAFRWKAGTEVVQFQVGTTGKLSDFKVLNSVCSDIDKEVIRVLKETDGMWKPGTNNGEPVAMEKEISLVFYIQEITFRPLEETFVNIATYYFNKGNKNLFIKNNPKKALTCFNSAIRYLPYDEALLFSRGIAKYELNDKEGAKSDWERMKRLAATGKSQKNIELITDNYNYKILKSFKELQEYISL